MALKKLVDENDPNQAQILNDIRVKLRTETFTRQSILEVIERYVTLICLAVMQSDQSSVPVIRKSSASCTSNLQ